MITNSPIGNLVRLPESINLEFKAVLPPSSTMARMIAAFANAQGGHIVLGVGEEPVGRVKVIGLSDDFRASQIVAKAIDTLNPPPLVKFGYQEYDKHKLYVITVEKSAVPIMVGDKHFVRKGTKNVDINQVAQNSVASPKIINLRQKLRAINTLSGSMAKFIEHYSSILNIVSDLGGQLYPQGEAIPTNNAEGKILLRIILSSCADNFEAYLSDLLYEIYLAKPDTLKSSNQVTVKEVLDCSDIQEFIEYVAKKKLSKLQRGSVKGFISENVQISSLNALSDAEQSKLEAIMQIRHLYAHKNGVVDEKFQQFFPGRFMVNDIHALSIDEFLLHFEELIDSVAKIDLEAINIYRIAAV